MLAEGLFNLISQAYFLNPFVYGINMLWLAA